MSFVVRTKSQNWIMCKGLLSKCCFVFHELSYTDVVSGIYNNVIVEWKSKNKTCPFGELLFEKSLCSSSDARRFPRWLKFHFSRLKPLTVLPNYFFSSSITVSYKINIKLCWFLKVEKLFAIKLKELKEFRIVLLFLSDPKIINNHIIRMKVFPNQVI